MSSKRSLSSRSSSFNCRPESSRLSWESIRVATVVVAGIVDSGNLPMSASNQTGGFVGKHGLMVLASGPTTYLKARTRALYLREVATLN